MTQNSPNNLDNLIEMLYTCRHNGKLDIEKVKQLMEAYKSNEEDWKKYAFFDEQKYTRNLVDDGNKDGGERLFNLIVLCWNCDQASTIHDHSNAECIMKILDGESREQRYERPSGSDVHNMVCVGDKTFKRDDVTHINDTMGLHRVSNPSSEKQTVTLHLYFPPFSQCGVYNEATGKQSLGEMTYYSINGVKVTKDGTNTDHCCGGKTCCK